MDISAIFPGVTPETIIKFAAGSCGGLVRSIEWVLDNPGVAPDFVLLGRNIFYGGIGGVVLGLEPITAFTSGMAGEYLLQSPGKRKAKPSVAQKDDAALAAAVTDSKP
jgi:hypothetical protein